MYDRYYFQADGGFKSLNQTEEYCLQYCCKRLIGSDILTFTWGLGHMLPDTLGKV